MNTIALERISKLGNYFKLPPNNNGYIASLDRVLIKFSSHKKIVRYGYYDEPKEVAIDTGEFVLSTKYHVNGIFDDTYIFNYNSKIKRYSVYLMPNVEATGGRICYGGKRSAGSPLYIYNAFWNGIFTKDYTGLESCVHCNNKKHMCQVQNQKGKYHHHQHVHEVCSCRLNNKTNHMAHICSSCSGYINNNSPRAIVEAIKLGKTCPCCISSLSGEICCECSCNCSCCRKRCNCPCNCGITTLKQHILEAKNNAYWFDKNSDFLPLPSNNSDFVRSYDKTVPGIFIFHNAPKDVSLDPYKPLVFPAKKVSGKLVIRIGEGEIIEGTLNKK